MTDHVNAGPIGNRPGFDAATYQFRNEDLNAQIFGLFIGEGGEVTIDDDGLFATVKPPRTRDNAFVRAIKSVFSGHYRHEQRLLDRMEKLHSNASFVNMLRDRAVAFENSRLPPGATLSQADVDRIRGIFDEDRPMASMVKLNLRHGYAALSGNAPLAPALNDPVTDQRLSVGGQSLTLGNFLKLFSVNGAPDADKLTRNYIGLLLKSGPRTPHLCSQATVKALRALLSNSPVTEQGKTKFANLVDHVSHELRGKLTEVAARALQQGKDPFSVAHHLDQIFGAISHGDGRTLSALHGRHGALTAQAAVQTMEHPAQLKECLLALHEAYPTASHEELNGILGRTGENLEAVNTYIAEHRPAEGAVNPGTELNRLKRSFPDIPEAHLAEIRDKFAGDPERLKTFVDRVNEGVSGRPYFITDMQRLFQSLDTANPLVGIFIKSGETMLEIAQLAKRDAPDDPHALDQYLDDIALFITASSGSAELPTSGMAVLRQMVYPRIEEKIRGLEAQVAGQPDNDELKSQLEGLRLSRKFMDKLALAAQRKFGMEPRPVDSRKQPEMVTRMKTCLEHIATLHDLVRLNGVGDRQPMDGTNPMVAKFNTILGSLAGVEDREKPALREILMNQVHDHLIKYGLSDTRGRICSLDDIIKSRARELNNLTRLRHFAKPEFDYTRFPQFAADAKSHILSIWDRYRGNMDGVSFDVDMKRCHVDKLFGLNTLDFPEAERPQRVLEELTRQGVGPEWHDFLKVLLMQGNVGVFAFSHITMGLNDGQGGLVPGLDGVTLSQELHGRVGVNHALSVEEVDGHRFLVVNSVAKVKGSPVEAYGDLEPDENNQKVHLYSVVYTTRIDLDAPLVNGAPSADNIDVTVSYRPRSDA